MSHFIGRHPIWSLAIVIGVAILLFLIFWELSKIHSRIKKAMTNPVGEPVIKAKEAVKV